MLVLSVFFALCLNSALGASKPADKLLPKSTLAVISFKDLKATNAAYANAPSSKLFADPALQPFFKKAGDAITTHILDPIKEETSIDLMEIGELSEGQLTLAIIPGENILESIPALVVLSDTGSKKSKAVALLDKIKGELAKNDVNVNNIRIQGSSFIEIPIPQEDRPEDFPKKGLEAVYFGISDTLLVLGTDKDVVDQIAVSNKGGTPPSLSQNTSYRTVARSMNPKADSYGWINFEPLINLIPALIGNGPAPQEGGPDPLTVFKALGITGLKGASFHSLREKNGEYSELTLHVPKSERSGIFNIFAGKNKPSGPLPNLPANVASFSRSRMDLKESWKGIETMLTKISPEMGGLMQFMMAGIGKDKDKNYDFKRDFIGNLGDDIITVVLPAEGNTLEDIAMQPQMFMIGSSSADKLLYSMKILSSMVPNLEVKSTDFLGKRILSADLPSPDGSQMGIYMTSSKGYLTITQNRGLLEQVIRGKGGKPNQIINSKAYRTAVDKVGGTGTGLFGFEDPAKTIGPFLSAVKGEPELFQEIIDNVTSNITLNPEAENDTWFDLDLLPDADQIGKYLGITVYSGSLDNDGYKMKMYAPDPEGL